MNSNRPYRRRLPRETIVAELQAGRGVQCCPRAVDACLDVLAARPEMWSMAPNFSQNITVF